jgi:hypothetical protein
MLLGFRKIKRFENRLCGSGGDTTQWIRRGILGILYNSMSFIAFVILELLFLRTVDSNYCSNYIEYCLISNSRLLVLSNIQKTKRRLSTNSVVLLPKHLLLLGTRLCWTYSRVFQLTHVFGWSTKSSKVVLCD